MRSNGEKFFIEIGSGDFDTLLGLARNGWHGIIVEPNADLLRNLIRYENVIYENVAILDYDGKTSFLHYDYGLLTSDDPVRPSEQFSMIRQHMLRGMSTTSMDYNQFNSLASEEDGDPKYKNFEQLIEVDCMTLDTLIDKYDVKGIDYLKIDAEHKDHIILESYSWKIKPTFLKVESMHWNSISNHYEIEDIETSITEMLTNMGYIVYGEVNDLYAVC
tara:strand:+ start:99 stop:752 length:654 start_codon:yes stop_codon:yes gene_type:complete